MRRGLPMIAQSPPMTYQDLIRLPDDLLRHELIDGEHLVSPAPALRHQRVVLHLASALSTFVRAWRLGTVLVAPVDVLFSQLDVVEPDVLYVASAHADRLRERYVAGAPDLAVEVLSPGSRGVDRLRKRRLYEAGGVAEYWIVDPDAETLEVYRTAPPTFPGAGAALSAPAPAPALQLRAALSRSAGDILESPLFAGLRLPLAEIFD
jgi:Uma2 family endonuclease